MAPTTQPRKLPAVLRGRSFWSAFPIGVAVMAGVDEIIFHQLLNWHHFYDGSTPQIGLLSDGLLHTAELVALVGGFFLLMDARRRPRFSSLSAWAGFLVGLGVFQLWDGIVDHKVLRLHQVRYGVDLLPYDIAWNVAGLVLLIAGVAMTAIATRQRAGR